MLGIHTHTHMELYCVCVCVCIKLLPNCVCCAKPLLSCTTLYDPMDCIPSGSPVRGDSPGKNIGVNCHVLLGNLPDPGIEPASPASADGFFTTSTTWELESNASMLKMKGYLQVTK